MGAVGIVVAGERTQSMQTRTKLETVLTSARAGDHPACLDCPSSPRGVHGAAYGESCREHGVDWMSPGSAASFMVVRDPADTTAALGKLCFVCNSDNSSDRTAKHAYDLWRGAVALENNEDGLVSRYLKGHYWTNAALHGTVLANIRGARRCCVGVLQDQIEALSPKVVIACGVEAATSLYDLGLISTRWNHLRRDLAARAYSEAGQLPSGQPVVSFCTYHTSARAVNMSVSRLYSGTTEDLLKERKSMMGNTEAVGAFCSQYEPNSAEGRGMRVLLLHWLEIGEAIRQAHGTDRGVRP